MYLHRGKYEWTSAKEKKVNVLSTTVPLNKILKLDNFFIFIASEPKFFVYLQKIVLQIMAKTKFWISTPKPDFHLST